MIPSPVHDTSSCLWRRLPRAARLERRSRDAQKRTPRNSDTQHERMEVHRGCPGNVYTELAFHVLPFSIMRKRILLSPSSSLVSRKIVLSSTSRPLVPALTVARILTH